MVKSVELDQAIGDIFRRPADAGCWAMAGDTLNTLDLKTLSLKPVGRIEGGLRHPTWMGKELYGAIGGEWVHITGAGG